MQAYYEFFRCWVWYRVGFIFFKCIYVDVYLRNVNQLYTEKNTEIHQKQKLGKLNIVEARSKKMWSISYETFVDIIAQVSLPL